MAAGSPSGWIATGSTHCSISPARAKSRSHPPSRSCSSSARPQSWMTRASRWFLRMGNFVMRTRRSPRCSIFLTSLLGPMLLGHSFHSEVIQRAYPEQAGVPFAGYGDAPVEGRRYSRGFAREIAGVAWRSPAKPLIRTGFLAPRLLRALVAGFERGGLGPAGGLPDPARRRR
jgi:hypothetical protein